MTHNYYPLDADIIIIGAGVSGMTAAYTMIQKTPSLEILILEAADTIGGRTLSIPLASEDKRSEIYDVGGEWICSRQELLLSFLSVLDIKTEKRHFDMKGKVIVECNKKVFMEAKKDVLNFCSVVEKVELTSFVTKIEDLCKLKTLNVNLASLTMEDYIGRHVSSNTVKAIIRSIILYNCGVSAANLTLGFYVFFCTSTRGVVNQIYNTTSGLHDVTIKNGAQEICKKIEQLLQAEVKIMTNANVTAINQYGAYVEVVTNHCHYICSCAIVTLPPPAILRLNFTPSMQAAKLRILCNSIKGEVAKFIATYQRAFWKEKNFTGEIYILEGYNQNRPLLNCYDTTTKNTPALTGHILACNELEVAKNLVLQQLSQHFGIAALTPLDFVIREWPDGSPMNCFHSLEEVIEARETEGRIYWTGAETSVEWYGTIAGAVNAGSMVATQVLYDMRPSALSRDDINLLTARFSRIRRDFQTFESIFKKLLNPLYYLPSFVAVLMVVKMWHRGSLAKIVDTLRNTMSKR